jgi:cytochrome c2
MGQGTQGQGGAKAPSTTGGQGKKKQSAKSAAKAKADPAPAPDWYVVTSDVVGNEVTAQDRPDQSIGTIKALVIDSTTRQTTLALIETGGFLGLDGKLVAVPFAALHFSAPGDRPTIRAKLATIKGAPAVTADTVVALVADAKWRADLAKRFRVTIAPPSPRDVASKSVGKTGAKSAGKSTPAATVGLAPAPRDAAAGGSYVQGICGACHTFDQGGGTRVGPNLYGIVDRTIAGAAGFSYSAALKSHGGSWTAANLDAFLKNPQGFARGTTMPFAGIASDNERSNVIAYLESLGTTQGGQK